MTGQARKSATDDRQLQALEALGEQLRRLRARQRLSVVALSVRAGLGRTTVSKALNGASVPSEETIIALSAVLRADPAPLLLLRSEAQAGSRTSERVHPKRSADRTTSTVVHAFERRYRQYVANRHEKLSVIGLDLARPDRSCWPLDAAYLSLDLAVASDHSSAGLVMDEMERAGGGVSAEQALSESQRVLIRGHAGSGKTTLLQWLAVGAARQNLPAELSHLNEHIPFVLPLRTLARTSNFPDPLSYLAAINCPLKAAQPAGWADGVMSSGQGLLLIDGVDEVAQEKRPRTREWLLDLLAAYPSNQFVVTTRPTAVPDGWLADFGFGELTVQPMSVRDVSVFITRWHDAARAGSSGDEEREQLGELEMKLRETVRSQHGLSQMTTTPLLCALVCALHRDRHGHLPHGRMELYSAALSMLLHRRDHERNIQPEGLRISERQSMRLLQRLAYWMVDNGQAEISRTDALHHISEALPSMPEVAGQGDDNSVLDHLVERSGVLRAPDDDTIDFVHRTFQDYLAAKAAIDARNIGVLVKNAHDDRWEDIVRMAVAHASPSDAAKILERLVSRGDRNTANRGLRARLHLLAAACVDYATELDPAMREEVDKRTVALLPPRSLEEGRTLASAGKVILELLPGPEGLDEDEAEAVTYTAGLIGGGAAIGVLKKYCTYGKGMVPWYIQMHWNHFDIGEYAKEVLARVTELPTLHIQSLEQLDELDNLRVPGNLSFSGDFDAEQIKKALARTEIHTLSLHRNDVIEGAEFLEEYQTLRSLTLDSCHRVNDLSFLPRTSISTLCLWLEPWEELAGLKGISNIKHLDINTVLPYAHLDEVPMSADLRSLELGFRTASGTSLRGVSRWENLTRLSIFTHHGYEHFAEISSLGNLQSLELFGWDIGTSLKLLSPMPKLRRLRLANVRELDAAVLHERFPGLRELRLSSPGAKIDLSSLAGMSELQIDVRNAVEVLGADQFPVGSVTVYPRPRD
ncbi:NACHT domain-containing protein [Streptomyces sp. NPDC014748]|uniref:NACHT domain-containing protein n=1 Tax=Streptomyces sp. NPDC014748 TaxID=3364905 RepID=UPI0036F8078A